MRHKYMLTFWCPRVPGSSPEVHTVTTQRLLRSEEDVALISAELELQGECIAFSKFDDSSFDATKTQNDFNSKMIGAMMLAGFGKGQSLAMVRACAESLREEDDAHEHFIDFLETAWLEAIKVGHGE